MNEEKVDSSPSGVVRYWLEQIQRGRKREKSYTEEAKKLVKLYEGARKREYQYNILYSNTETLFPALFNDTPRPVISRRFAEDDPIGLAVSQVLKRTLVTLQDPNNSDVPTFQELMGAAVLDALVPGRGITRWRYEADIAQTPEGFEAVNSETIVGEVVGWDKIVFGYAKRWERLPWLAFEHTMTREELVDNFGADIAFQVNLSKNYDAAELEDDTGYSTPREAYDDAACVYEIWHKRSRKVFFVSEGYDKGPLKAIDDPLGLSGFYPMAKPLQFIQPISMFRVVPLYRLYEEQAKELNRITVRINKIINAMKVRGFYDSTLTGIDRILENDDNTLVPTDNPMALQQAGGLERFIWLMPLEKLVQVLTGLYQQREQIKQVIYEITGIADVLRGSSVASETASAQQIKSQWGTLRLKRAQAEVARYARDSLRIVAEIAAEHFSVETLAAISQIQLMTGQQKAMAQQQIAQAKALTAQAPPEAQQQLGASMQAAEAAAAEPSWDEVKAMMASDKLRQFHIDIETNSTVDIEATEDKQLIGEFMNALAQFLNGVAPLVQEGVLPFDAAKSIMVAVTRRYRFGDEVEKALMKMQPPQPSGEDQAKVQAEQAKAAAEMQKLQMEGEQTKAEHAMKMEEMQLDHQIKMAELQAKMAMLQVQTQAKAELAQQQAAIVAQERAEARSDRDMAHEQKKEMQNNAPL